ncbi:MAG: hypothetical protein J6R32_02185 [Bacteroidales bacterium]|nr:hypothetical protein [Bacteroidales bacterium]
MKRYLFLLMLAIMPALAMAQSEKTNKGAHYLEVKTGLSISDIPLINTFDAPPVEGLSFDMRYAYGLINNLDIIAAFSTYSGYESFDEIMAIGKFSYIDRMYYCNALQIGVRGKVKCFDFMNLKLSLTGGLMNHAQTCYGDYPPLQPYTVMYLRSCVGGMFEVDFDISKRMSLGLFYGRTTTILNKNAGVKFDNTGLSLSVRL